MISGIDYGKGNDESCAITFVSPEYIEKLEQENQSLKDRIEKAIEYIEKNKLNGNKISEMLCGSEVMVLLEILGDT